MDDHPQVPYRVVQLRYIEARRQEAQLVAEETINGSLDDTGISKTQTDIRVMTKRACMTSVKDRLMIKPATRLW